MVLDIRSTTRGENLNKSYSTLVSNLFFGTTAGALLVELVRV